MGTNIYKQVHNYSIKTGKIFTKQCKNKKSVKVMSTVNNKKGRRRKRNIQSIIHLSQSSKRKSYYVSLTRKRAKCLSPTPEKEVESLGTYREIISASLLGK